MRHHISGRRVMWTTVYVIITLARGRRTRRDGAEVVDQIIQELRHIVFTATATFAKN